MKEDLINTIANYYNELDDSLQKLSDKKEEYIKLLPSWVLCYRNIYIGHLLNYNYYIVKVIPNESLNGDQLEYREIETIQELKAFSVINLAGNIDGYFKSGMEFGDIKLEGDVMGPSEYILKGTIGFKEGNAIPGRYSSENAKKDAINFWNAAVTGLKSNNFIGSLNAIFQKFNGIISHKAFKERKTHRYINAHSRFLLPNFKNCYFEKRTNSQWR